MKILTNHLGYLPNVSCQAILQAPAKASCTAVHLQNEEGKTFAISNEWQEVGPVASWKDWHFYELSFSSNIPQGTYTLYTTVNGVNLASHTFAIQSSLFSEKTLSDTLFYFKSQRASGKFNKADRIAPFFGEREGTRNVSGGWYDASGDTSKYLTHLSYSNFLNPQQIPMVVWNFLESYDVLPSNGISNEKHKERILEEALFGADFLVRMQDPEGYFYTNVFDKWTKDTEQREICAFSTILGHKSEDYQAAWRQGGGVSIAALARTYGHKTAGDFHPDVYLERAEKGYDHLLRQSVKYIEDGKENILDDYCKLLASTELFKVTQEELYLTQGRFAADSLVERLSHDDNYSGWFRSDDKDRPFYHAAEEGLPLIALLDFAEIETDLGRKETYHEVIRTHLDFWLTVTSDTTNPFGYARQYQQAVDGPKKSSFFMPHKNETEYWWQGENARLGSLATAALKATSLTYRVPELLTFAQNQIDWILGKNPFDVCMMWGHGYNNMPYVDGYPSTAGGICNGITSGFFDEEDIDFAPQHEAATQMDQSWRWGEQWIPHGSWFSLAVSYSAMVEEKKLMHAQ